jgi:hypothetical protein
MPTLLYVCRGQSESIFHEDTTGQYREAALVTAGLTQSGGARTGTELTRRLPTWTINRQGSRFAPDIVRVSGTSFVDEWIDPRIAPGNDTGLTGNTDARILGKHGQTYFDSLDRILTANVAASDAIALVWMRQTWESDDRAPGIWPFNIVEYARAVTLFVSLELAKISGFGKPARVWLVHPGPTDRGNANHALMREITQHLAVNGRRSTRADLAAFPVIAGFYIGGYAHQQVTFAAAQQADNVAAGTDFAHQSMGSSLRVGASLALEFAKWLSSGTSQEFDRHPYVESAFRVAGSPNIVRAKVKITTGNALKWQGPATEDTDVTIYGGTTASATTQTYAHLSVHSTPIDNATAPTPLPATAIAVVGGAPSGYAYLDVTLASAVPATCYFTVGPSRQALGYTRRTEAIATSNKRLLGLFEDGTVSATLIPTAALNDVLASPPTVVMPVFPVTNLLVGPEESDASVSNLSDAGEAAITAAMGGSPGARPSAWYLGLGTGFTDASGLTGELSGGGYERLLTGPWTVAGRVAGSPTAGPFATITGATHWGLFTAITGGTALFGGALTDTSSLGVNAGRFTLALSGDVTDYYATTALTWLMTLDAVTLPVAPLYVAAGTGLVGGALAGELPNRAAVTPTFSSGVATFTGAHTIAITGDGGTLAAIGVYDAVAGGNLLLAKAVSPIATGSAGTVSIATFTLTLD